MKKPFSSWKFPGGAQGVEKLCGDTRKIIFRCASSMEFGLFYLYEIKGHTE
jgi:hypothetical protein